MSKWGMNTLSLYVQRNEEVISADSRSLISKRYCTVTSAMNREFWNITKYSLQGTTQGNGLTGGVPPVRFSM